jgi:hypothetical protein
MKPELVPRNDESTSADAIERAYTVKYIAEQLTLSTDTVRRLFECENGVLRIGNPSRRVGRKLKRAYFTLRIPLSVYLRVQDRLQQREKKPPQSRRAR